jgi:hypothetical protein
MASSSVFQRKDCNGRMLQKTIATHVTARAVDERESRPWMKQVSSFYNSDELRSMLLIIYTLRRLSSRQHIFSRIVFCSQTVGLLPSVRPSVHPSADVSSVCRKHMSCSCQEARVTRATRQLHARAAREDHPS